MDNRWGFFWVILNNVPDLCAKFQIYIIFYRVVSLFYPTYQPESCIHVFLFIRTNFIRTQGLEMDKETIGKQWVYCLRTKES